MSTTGTAERAVATRSVRVRGLSLRPLSDTTGVEAALVAAINEGRMVEARALQPRFYAMVRERQPREYHSR